MHLIFFGVILAAVVVGSTLCAALWLLCQLGLLIEALIRKVFDTN